MFPKLSVLCVVLTDQPIPHFLISYRVFYQSSLIAHDTYFTAWFLTACPFKTDKKSKLGSNLYINCPVRQYPKNKPEHNTMFVIKATSTKQWGSNFSRQCLKMVRNAGIPAKGMVKRNLRKTLFQPMSDNDKKCKKVV